MAALYQTSLAPVNSRPALVDPAAGRAAGYGGLVRAGYKGYEAVALPRLWC